VRLRLVVCDDPEPVGPEQAFQLLLSGMPEPNGQDAPEFDEAPG